MDRMELEAARKWVEQWRITGPLLDEIKTRELREMTEEEAREASERLLAAVPNPQDWSADPLSSGMVEQQRWFIKMRQS